MALARGGEEVRRALSKGKPPESSSSAPQRATRVPGLQSAPGFGSRAISGNSSNAVAGRAIRAFVRTLTSPWGLAGSEDSFWSRKSVMVKCVHLVCNKATTDERLLGQGSTVNKGDNKSRRVAAGLQLCRGCRCSSRNGSRLHLSQGRPWPNRCHHVHYHAIHDPWDVAERPTLTPCPAALPTLDRGGPWGRCVRNLPCHHQGDPRQFPASPRLASPRLGSQQ